MARIKSLAGLPIEQHHSPNVGGRMSAHRGPVLHIAEGSYRGTIAWQANPDQRYADGTRVTTSSTWVVGKQRGEWAQMVDSDTVAWCQRSGSHTRTSIELAGHAGDRPTGWQIEACAQILAWEHTHYGVPLQVATTDAEDGLGHHSMDREWAGVEWGHEDCPGQGVIAAKPAIVARAKKIVSGEDDMTPIEARNQAVLGMYDALWIAAHRADLPRDPQLLSYAKVGAAIRDNLQAITVQPILAALASADSVDEEKLAAALAPAVAEAVVAMLPEDRDDVTVDELTEAMRQLLVSGIGAIPSDRVES